MSNLSVVSIAAGSAGLYVLYFLSQRRKNSLPLPPGPRGLPIVGNVLELPPPDAKPWQHWAEHKDKYGPISSVTVLGQTIVIINDYSIAVDLLERQSSVSSGRPILHFGGVMVGYDVSVPLIQHGDRHRRYRRMFHKFFNTRSAMEPFVPFEVIEVRRFLLRTMRDPSSLEEQLRRLAGAIILRVTYGYTIEPEGKDYLVGLADQCMREFALSSTPGLWAVDMAPFLRYLPDWVPGTSFKKIAARFKATLNELRERPFEYVRQQLKTGQVKPSFISSMLPEAKTPEEEQDIKWCSSSAYGGGSDTTVSSLYTFFLAMTLYPEVQRRAQKELDEVVGNDLFPTLEDRPRLPYVEAVLKESMRWQLVAPLALPHAAVEDTEYNGYFIPKGSIVMANCWAIAHNPELYKDPYEFKPERFLGINGREPEMDSYKFAFGFGRRACPGRDFADTSMWLAVAMSLSVFNISKVRDEAGNEITPEIRQNNEIVCHVLKFPCSITPRSERAAALVSSVELEHPYEPGDAEKLFAIPWNPS